MAMSMATAGGSRRTTWCDGVHLQNNSPTTSSSGGACHRGHRLWASMPEAFWVYVYKVQRCPQASHHLWTLCPYAHRGERARRRDPRRFPYLPVACPDYRASQQLQLAAGAGAAAPSCARGVRCRYAHGVFELWLHPARFRTRMCEAGLLCPRRICFFAHSLAERRSEYDAVLPLVSRSLHPPPPPLHVSWSPDRRDVLASLPVPGQVDIITREMVAKLRLHGGDGGASASPSSSRLANNVVAVAATPVLALLEGSPEDEDPVERGGNWASEEGSVAGDYPHLDLIRDMVMS